MRKRDAVGYSSLPTSPVDGKGRQHQIDEVSIEDSQQFLGQDSEKENKKETSKDLDKNSKDYMVSQNHNVKSHKKAQNKNKPRNIQNFSPSQLNGSHNGSFYKNKPSLTPLNMNRIAGTSFYDCRNQRMELSNAYKLINIIKRENHKIKSKQDQDTSLIDQVDNLKNEIIAKQKEIDQMKIENRTLRKIKRKQENALSNHGEEARANLKIQQLQCQLVELTSVNKSIKNKNIQNEKNFKKQHAFLVDIYNEYRFICSQSNLQPKIKFENYNAISQEMSSNISNNNQEDDEYYYQNQDNQFQIYADSFSSSQFQKQVTDVVNMSFTQKNFLKLKEMMLYSLKQLDDIQKSNYQQDQNYQKQQFLSSKQQKVENFQLKQSLNKQKLQQLENNRYDLQYSEESQLSQRSSVVQSSSQNRQNIQNNYSNQKNNDYQRNQQNVQKFSQNSYKLNDSVVDQDHNTSKIVQARDFNQEELKKRIETDSERSTNFLKAQKKEKNWTINENQEVNQKVNVNNKQIKSNKNKLKEDKNQNEKTTRQDSKGNNQLKEVCIGERYRDIDAKDFNDSDILKNKNDLKIVSISVYINKELGIINGLRCDYSKSQQNMNQESKVYKGKENVFQSNNSEKVKVKMEDGDYLKTLTAVYDVKDKIIRQITFISSKNQTFVVGEVDLNDQNKRFQLQHMIIDKDEYPICLFGTLKPISKQSDSKNLSEYISCLCFLGFQVYSHQNNQNNSMYEENQASSDYNDQNEQ